MRRPRGIGLVFLLLFSVPLACADLNVLNYNDPDIERTLREPNDVIALIAASYNTWFRGTYGDDVEWLTPSLFLSNQALQHSAPWANAGMEQYGRIPRIGLVNDAADPFYGELTVVWYKSYRAIGAVNDGFKALTDPDIASVIGETDRARLRAYGRFVQGLSLATVALFFDRGFVVDETTDLDEPQEPLPYPDLMEAAFGFFDDALSIADAEGFTLPFDWMSADLSSEDLVRVIRSYRARFRAQVARTPEERAEVDWLSDGGTPAPHPGTGPGSAARWDRGHPLLVLTETAARPSPAGGPPQHHVGTQLSLFVGDGAPLACPARPGLAARRRSGGAVGPHLPG